ncbi:hypothetical protein E1091_00185 [Micromonospora fluostatini]|uniref:Uncharacterized protein n=1 Tax=Micromonospora fluostatini TaxID=1629071 RepID=A0ABY2DM85_9ACTN|nr:hypothetical protein E1091_00185 [Micromonospora fluostatini]
MTGVKWDALVPEGKPFEMVDVLYHLRRGPDVDGMPRWSVFQDGAFAPVGYLQGHYCPDYHGDPEFAREPRLIAFDKAGERIGSPPKRAFETCLGCVTTLMNALVWVQINFDAPCRFPTAPEVEQKHGKGEIVRTSVRELTD